MDDAKLKAEFEAMIENLVAENKKCHEALKQANTDLAVTRASFNTASKNLALLRFNLRECLKETNEF